MSMGRAEIRGDVPRVGSVNTGDVPTLARRVVGKPRNWTTHYINRPKTFLVADNIYPRWYLLSLVGTTLLTTYEQPNWPPYWPPYCFLVGLSASCLSIKNFLMWCSAFSLQNTTIVLFTLLFRGTFPITWWNISSGRVISGRPQQFEI